MHLRYILNNQQHDTFYPFRQCDAMQEDTLRCDASQYDEMFFVKQIALKRVQILILLLFF